MRKLIENGFFVVQPASELTFEEDSRFSVPNSKNTDRFSTSGMGNRESGTGVGRKPTGQMPRFVFGFLAALFLVNPVSDSRAAQQGARPSAVWVGQDGSDLVGPSSKAGPSGVQDIRLQLRGLPIDQEITSIDVRGHGRDEWRYRGARGPWATELVRQPGASTADLYLEPTRLETGRSFQITIVLENGRKTEFYLQGGKADPTLRMPEAALSARWIGQDGQDRTGIGPGVGPDGFQDVRIELDRLTPDAEVQSVQIDGQTDSKWCFGLNPEGHNNAELVRDPGEPARALLYLSPNADLNGQRLSIQVRYANGTSDQAEVIAGRVDPRLKMPAPRLPRRISFPHQTSWYGQETEAVTSPGAVHLMLDGLPPNLEILSASLNDGGRGAWVYRASGTAFSHSQPERPMTLRRSGRSPRVDLFFPPDRNLNGKSLTLCLLFQGGDFSVVNFEGKECDPGLRTSKPASRIVTAQPGQDLHSLVAGGGTIRLAQGTHRLNRPLVLSRAVELLGEPGATLLFEQPEGTDPWTSAIKIHQGHTRLDGFAVRFHGPIRWDRDVSYGPAIIGTTDNQDPPNAGGTKVRLNLSRLDLESPPSASDWEEAPRLLRLVSAESGTVAGNTFKGGAIEFRGGPWQITDNRHLGSLPKTFAYSAYSGHHTMDLQFERNSAKMGGPSGKLWRFLVLTQTGDNPLVRACQVEGVGPRDDDDRPHPNAPEVVLTESYRLHFEGHPAAISDDGLLLAVPEPQGTPAGPGSVVALLSGPEAGRWVRIAHALDEQTYLLDQPLPVGDHPVSIAAGFVGMVFDGNQIDSRGSTIASNLVLAGNHFGSRVHHNILLGGGEAFRIVASGSEQPVHWGWSRSPMLDLEILKNQVEDSTRGGRLYIEHTRATKSSKGRVYLTATMLENTATWSPSFWKMVEADDPVAFQVGQGPTLDPTDLVATLQQTRVQPPIGVRPKHPLRIDAGLVNGREYVGQRFELEIAPAESSEARSP